MYLAATGFDSKGAASGVRARHRIADSLAPCVIGSHRSAYDPSTSQLRGGAYPASPTLGDTEDSTLRLGMFPAAAEAFSVLAQGNNPAAGACGALCPAEMAG